MPNWLAIIRLLRWDKPAGRLILLIPALWGVVLGGRGVPPISLVLIMVVGTLATSGAGCVVNDLWDRNLDNRVARTRQRPLASRQLSVQVAIAIGLIGLICAFGLALFLNPGTLALCVAVVPIIGLYPAAKRFFPVPQLVLALAWGFAVLISWTAATGQAENLPFWEPATGFLWGATVLWTLGFDTVYALADVVDDERIGIQSSARFFGSKTPLAVGFFFGGASILLVLTGLSLQLHPSYYLAVVLAIAIWGWQVKELCHYPHQMNLYGQIFRQNVWQGFFLLIGMLSGSWL